MIRRALRVAAWSAALSALAAGGLAAWVHVELRRPFAGWSGEAVIIELPAGLDAGRMLRRLGQAGVVRRPELVRGWLAWRGEAGSLRAGEYRFEAPIAPLEVLRRLRFGDVLLHAVTLPEGLTRAEIASRFVAAGFGPPEALRAAFDDPTPILPIDPDARDLEGYLFPDTYHFPRGESAPRIARALVGRFREVADEGYILAADRVGLSLREAVTLASLIEKETSLPAERPQIARVFHNRLARGMRLECDPTVIYAIERDGGTVDRLTYADLRVESPWNTYRVTGLPPGPIAQPGLASLEAVVHPAAGDEIYFVAAPGGGHRFSTTHAEHLAAVAEWRRYSRSSR